MCVELKCYPGRILIGTFCTPLLEITYNLGYVLAVELRGFMSEHNTFSEIENYIINMYGL
jgi:hypothetical protein